MSYIIFSRSSGSTLKLEGQGYNTKKEAEKYVRLFQARTEALEKIQQEFSINFHSPRLKYDIVNSQKLGIDELV